MELTSKTKRIIGIAAVLLLLFLVFLLPYGKAWILTARHGDEFKGAEYVSWIDPEEVCDCKVYSYSAKKKAKVLLVLGEYEGATVEWLEWDEEQEGWTVVREETQWSTGGNGVGVQWPLFYPEKYGDLGVVGANLLLLLGETLLFYLICTFFYVKSRKEWVYFLVLILGSGLRKAFPWLPAGVWPFLMACLVSCLIGIGFLRLLKRNYAKTVRISAWNAGICLVLGLILRLALGGE